MSVLNIKKVSTMPGSATPSAIYFEKGGAETRIKMYVTDINGTAFPVGIISEVDVLNTLLAGYSVGTNTPLVSTNSILTAFQNVQGQLNALSTLVSGGVKVPLPIDCSTNPNYPAAVAGDSYRVTVAGRIGGASGPLVQVGDLITAITANAGGTHAAVGSQWYILQANTDNATESVTGLTRIATSAEADGLSEGFAYLTPLRAPQSVRASPLTGFTVGANTAVVATDTVLQAFGKLQGQISAFGTGLGDYVTIATAQTITGLKAFTSEIQSKVLTGTNALGMFEGNTAVRTWGLYNVNAGYDFAIRRHGGAGDKNMFGISRASDAAYVNGRFSIGTTTAPTGTSLTIGGGITGAVNSIGVNMVAAIQSDVTSTSISYQSLTSTVASAFSINSIYHYVAAQGVFGVGSAATYQFGYYVSPSIIGATNNYGFRGDIPAGANRWNLYMSGTADNHLAGNLWIGTAAGTTMLDVAGNARIRTISNFGSTPADVLVPGPTGVIHSRTLAEFKTDLGLGSGITGTGTINYHSKFTAAGVLGNSMIFDDGSNIGIGTIATTVVSGFKTITFRGLASGSTMFLGNTSAEYAYIAGTIGEFAIAAIRNVPIKFYTSIGDHTVNTEKWRIAVDGILQSNGAQTIQTSTGVLSLQPSGGLTGGVNITANLNMYSSAGLGIIRNTVSTGAVVISGSSIYTEGGRIDLYGSTHATSPNRIDFRASNVVTWSILPTGIFESTGAQTIQTSTGSLTLATAAGNGNVNLNPHGTGVVNAQKELLVQALGTNVVPAADQLRVNGIGIMGNRVAMYITNGSATGTVIIGNNGLHAANPIATFGSTGTIFNILTAATTDTDKFLVSDAGVIKFRTGAELLADIGGMSSTTAVPTTRLISTNNGITGGGDLSVDRTHSLTGQALALHNLATNGFIVRTALGTVAARKILSAAATIEVTNGDAVAADPNLEMQWGDVQW